MFHQRGILLFPRANMIRIQQVPRQRDLLLNAGFLKQFTHSGPWKFVP